MKNLLAFALLLFVFGNLHAQLEMKLTKHVFTAAEIAAYKKLDIDQDFFCKGNPCPIIYKVNGHDAYKTHKGVADITLVAPDNIMRRIKNNPNIIGFVSKGTLKLFHKKTGLLQEVKDIRIILGDK